jgi:homoserine dehydrogenase
MMYGRGAGPNPTASAVLSDAARLAKQDQTTWFSRLWHYDNIEHVPIGDIETGYHLIFPVLDKPGIIGRITSTLGSYNINIESAHAQIPEARNGTGLVQIVCRQAKERDVRAAFRAVQDLPLLSGPARLFRIEVQSNKS